MCTDILSRIRPSARKHLRLTCAFIALLAVAVATSEAQLAPTSTALGQEFETIPAQLAPQAIALGQEFGAIADKVCPAVVSINTVHIIESDGGRMGMLENFFEQQMPDDFGFNAQAREFWRRGLGSGVIISKDGIILTNNHVVAGASELTVTLLDQRQFDATVVGTDPPTDLAVLKIDGNNLPVAELGASDELAIGGFVLAIGNPFGLSHTLTVGNISATGRANVGIAEYEDFIQTDAAINPGNSGGPLVDMNGKVVGINTAIASRSGGSMGVGFAVPSNMARSVMTAIRDQGKVTRGWLGVAIQDLTAQLSKALGTEIHYGALIADVVKDSPAEKADLRHGDIIIKFNNDKIESSRDLRRKVAAVAPQARVDLTRVRDGRSKTVQVMIGERPAHGKTQPQEQEKLGFSVKNLTEPLRKRFGIEAKDGVVVAAVSPTSPAFAQGLRTGMVIREVDRKAVKNVRQFRRAVGNSMDDDSVLFLVSLRGQISYMLVPFKKNNK